MRLISSRPSRLSGQLDAPHAEPAGDLYSPFARRRLTAEEIRDSILATSGELDGTVARGHPFPSPITWGYTQHAPYSGVYHHNKRSVYLMTQRIKRHPFLALFDGADPNATTAERVTTTVPTQALFFLNDPFVHAKAEKCATTAAGCTARRSRANRAGVAQGARCVLRREIEREQARQFFDAYRSELAAAGQDRVELQVLAAYVRTLFGSNEFLFLD